MALQIMNPLYGVPPEEFYTPLYGTQPPLSSKFLVTIISLLLNPIFISISFIVGTILFILSHKKIFIIIPLIFAIIFLLGQIFGISEPAVLY